MATSFGIVKEDHARERRVPLTPAAVEALVGEGCPVFVETGAGIASRFRDEEYQRAGAQTVYDRDEVYGRSGVVLRISTPSDTADAWLLRPGQVLFSFLHLGVVAPELIDEFLKKRVTTVGYELIEDERGELPFLIAMSEIAGRMCMQIAARFLESSKGGRGVILGGVTGVPPASVVILGAGNVGRAAARMALAAGAEVLVLDRDLGRLRQAAAENDQRIVTAMVNTFNLRKALRFADVVIGAVQKAGERTPHLVSDQMVSEMKPGSLILDISIDQGGCFETSRPTTLDDPVFVRHGVIHYCVPNIPALAARSASFGLTNALLPFLTEIGRRGPEAAFAALPGLARGVYTRDGVCVNRAAPWRLDREPADPAHRTN